MVVEGMDMGSMVEGMGMMLGDLDKGIIKEEEECSHRVEEDSEHLGEEDLEVVEGGEGRLVVVEGGLEGIVEGEGEGDRQDGGG